MTVYLVINQFGNLDTFFTLDALLNAGYSKEDAKQVSLDEYKANNGIAYVNENKEIVLGFNPAVERLKQIRKLKQFLQNTDYIVIKIAEGCATKEEYQDILDKREQTRQEINCLEA